MVPMIPPARYDVPLIRVRLVDSSGNGVTGLAAGDSNMRIAIARDNGGSVGVYGASNILSIATIGTYSDPGSAAQCRFGQVDATNFPGLYEVQFNQSFLSSARAAYVVRIWDMSGTPRFQQMWASVPMYMPVRVDHVRDTLQTSRDLGARLDVAVSTRAAASDVLNSAVEGSYTLAQLLRLMGAVLLGSVEGAPLAPRFKAAGGTDTRVTATTDADGNRGTVILTP